MNWLAHLYLSEPQLDMRLGNLLGDAVRGPELEAMSAAFKRGVQCHRIIDAYTDTHEVVRRSRHRLDSTYRRFSGVLVDVFFDHFLARDWEHHAPLSLESFNRGLAREIRAARIRLPSTGAWIVQRMILEERFLGYRSTAGIEQALKRISQRVERRFGRDVALGGAISLLDTCGEALKNDFNEFFPQLQAHVRQWSQFNPAH